MGTGTNVGQGYYNMQWLYPKSQEPCEHPRNHSAMTLRPAMRDDHSRDDYAQYADMRVGIGSPAHMQYPMTPPADFDKSYIAPRTPSDLTYSRYAGVHLSPPVGAYHPEIYYGGYSAHRRPPAVTFRNPFANHQNHIAYVHSSPPPSPTDMRGFRGDRAVLRRPQDGGY